MKTNKTLLLLLIGILIGMNAMAQKYTVKLSGYIEKDPGLSYRINHCRNDHYLEVTFLYEDGSQSTTKRIGFESFGSNGFRSVEVIDKIDINTNKYIRSIKVKGSRAYAGRCERRSATTELPISRSERRNFCLKKRFIDTVNNDIIKQWIGELTLEFIPNYEIKFSDGTSVSATYNACTGDDIQVEAPTGYPNENEFSWQFLAGEKLGPIPTPAFKAVRDAYERARTAHDNCTRNNPGFCSFTQQELNIATSNFFGFRGETHFPVPDWRFISGKTGRKVGISLDDMYSPSSSEYSSKIGTPIQIRAIYRCAIEPKEEDIQQLTVRYFPAPPKVTRAEKEDLNCATSKDGSFRLFFDRNLNRGEVLNINLYKLNNGATPVSNPPPITGQPLLDRVNDNYIPSDQNIGITRLVNNSHTWNEKNITRGHYAALVTGYRSLREAQNAPPNPILLPLCEPFWYFFEIVAPDEVSFLKVQKLSDQKCEGSDSGEIRIEATGGSGTYNYDIKGPKDVQGSFTESAGFKVVAGLPAGTYTITLKDSNNCFEKGNTSQTITIDPVTPISHNAINPQGVGAPGLEDGSIRISSVSGGTPFINSGRASYNYSVLVNSVVHSSGRGESSGFDILGLPAGTHTIRYTDANGCTKDLPLPRITAPDRITFNLAIKNPSCFAAADGTLSVSKIRGGYGNYTIEWKRNESAYGSGTSITGGEGSYDVTIKDNRSGIAERRNIRFTIPPKIEIESINATPIICFGGTSVVTVTVKGSAPVNAYQYAEWTGSTTQWQDSNTFTLAANAAGYRFRVRNRLVNTCLSDISTTPLRISEPAPITIQNTAVTQNTVFGQEQGQINLTVRGGKSPYTVTWTRDGAPIPNSGTAITNLPAGVYVARITDSTNSCSMTSGTITVTQPDLLVATIVAIDTIDCFGQRATLAAEASGGSESYTYTWRHNGSILSQTARQLSNLAPGRYDVQVNDGYTTADATINIQEPDPLALTIRGEALSCFDGSDGRILLNPSGGTPPYSFSIDAKNSYFSEATLTNRTIENLRAATYEVWIKDANGCEMAVPQRTTLGAPDPIIITENQVIDATTPGGTNGSIDISIQGGTGAYTITWTKADDPAYTATTEDISNQNAGMYTVTVQDENNCIESTTLEIQEPLPIEVLINTQAPVLCNGETFAELIAVVSGGYPIISTPADFRYRWFRIENGREIFMNVDIRQDVLTAVGSGTYKVEVSDAEGETATHTYFLAEPEALTVALTAAPTQVLCHGAATGAIDITVAGGPKDASGAYLPYSFTWTKTEDPTFSATTEDLTNITAGTYHVVVVDDNLCTTSLAQAVRITEPTAPIELQQESITHLTGFQTGNGGIFVRMSGGTPPYRYEWRVLGESTVLGTTPVIQNIQAGTYELTVRDANECVFTKAFEVTQPPLLEITNISADSDILCHGDATVSLVATVAGGVPPYTYQWYYPATPTLLLSTTNELVNRAAGTYELKVVDANNNEAIRPYTILQPDPLAATYAMKAVNCYGGTDGGIDLSITGGTAPYTYIWSTGATTQDIDQVATGEYTVTVRDVNFCEIVVPITVTQPAAALYVDAVVINDATGHQLTNGSIDLTIAGGTAPYTYEWKASSSPTVLATTQQIENLGEGTYTVAVEDANGCVLALQTYAVGAPDPIGITLSEEAINCFGETGTLTATVVGGVPPYSYVWTDAAGTTVSTEASTGAVASGIYNVSITDANNNQEAITGIPLDQPTALVIDAITVTDVTCYQGNDGKIEVSVSGGTGDYTYVWNNLGSTTSELSDQIAGAYELTITDANGCSIQTGSITIDEPVRYDVTNANLIRPSGDTVADGSIRTTITGGVAPYTYTWTTSGTVLQSTVATTAITDTLANIPEGTYTLTVEDQIGCRIQKTYSLADPGELLIAVELVTPVACFGAANASLTVVTTGGSGGNTYTWYDAADDRIVGNRQTLQDIPTGNYYVIVSNVDGIQEQSAIFEVGTPDPVIVTLSKTPPLCHGEANGSMTLTASGGTNSYTYRIKTVVGTYSDWLPFTDGAQTTIAGLASESYHIQVRDTNGCLFEEDGRPAIIRELLSQPDAIRITDILTEDASGYQRTDGSIQLTAIGGVAPYTYQWQDASGAIVGTTDTLTGIGAGAYSIQITDANACTYTQEIAITEPALLEVSIQLVNIVLCKDDTNGSLNAVAQGGIANTYTYQWFVQGDPTAIHSGSTLSSIGSGTYYVVVTDANANTAQSAPFVLTEPETLTVSLSADYTLCGDSTDWTITSSVQGGTPPYTYTWDTGATTAQLDAVFAGSYTVLVVDANGCTAETSITIAVPPALAVSAINTPVTCFGGSDGALAVNVTGGLPPYTYQWNNGSTTAAITALVADTYTAIVTDSKGCTFTESYTITQPAELIVDLGSDVTLCVDQVHTVDATLATGVDYLWTSDTGFQSTDAIIEIEAAGTYTVVVTDAQGCTATDSITVARADEEITASFIASSQVFAGESFVIVDISDPQPDSLSWIVPEGVAIEFQDTSYAELRIDTPGEYDISVQIGSGDCIDIQTKKVLVVNKTIETDPTATSEEETTKIDFKTYPNPNRGNFTAAITLAKPQAVSVKVYNMVNNLLVDSREGAGKDTYEFTYDLGYLPGGIYFIWMETSSGNQVHKLIIE